jgi:acyl dehydratase
LAISLEQILDIRSENVRFAYSERESLLYSLSVGLGENPLDEQELQFVTEGDQQPRTVATMATVLTQFAALKTSGIDYAQVLHAEQRLTLHRPLPPCADILADYAVVGVADKGPQKGILVYAQTRVRTASNNQPLYTAGATIMARNDGGIGSGGILGPAVHLVPNRAPDRTTVIGTRPNQALLYRLNGDRNPLHSSPAAAALAGFRQPILHGLCTYGIACRAILASVCEFDHTRIGRFDARFASPVYPGESIATDIWMDGDTVSFRCRVPERDVVVLNNGVCVLSPSVRS